MNIKKNYSKKRHQSYASAQAHAVINGLIGVIVIAFISFYFFLTPLNPQSIAFWLTLIIALFVFAALKSLTICSAAAGRMQDQAAGQKTWKDVCRHEGIFFILPLIAIIALLLIALSGSPVFSSHKYAAILNVEDAVFSDDLSESLGTDSIALMDTASARMLGDREIGSLSNVVSQFNVSDDYTQIDYNGKPAKVAALDYAGFFKWIGNKSDGVPGYVTVNPVSMSASYVQCSQPMTYVPSAYFHEDAARYIRFHYPTLLLGNLHFEIDEQGQPYYVMSVYKNTISLFGGQTVTGAITLNPSTGELTHYALSVVPNWVDVVVDGDLLCRQYNWSGTLKNGFMNSLIGKKVANGSRLMKQMKMMKTTMSLFLIMVMFPKMAIYGSIQVSHPSMVTAPILVSYLPTSERVKPIITVSPVLMKSQRCQPPKVKCRRKVIRPVSRP